MKTKALALLSLLLAVCAVVCLFGCGGGGSGSVAAPTPTPTAGLALAAYSPAPIEALQPVQSPIAGAAAIAGANDHANSLYYPSVDTWKKSATLEMLKDFKTYQQTGDYSGAAACAVMAFQHFGITHISEQLVATELELTEETATATVDALTHTFTSRGYTVKSSEDTANADGVSYDTAKKLSDYLLDCLNKNRVVLAQNAERGGSWRVIVGYDGMDTSALSDDVLIFADPCDTTDHAQDGFCVGSFERFYETWFDAGTLPEGERAQQYVTVSQ